MVTTILVPHLECHWTRYVSRCKVGAVIGEPDLQLRLLGAHLVQAAFTILHHLQSLAAVTIFCGSTQFPIAFLLVFVDYEQLFIINKISPSITNCYWLSINHFLQPLCQHYLQKPALSVIKHNEPLSWNNLCPSTINLPRSTDWLSSTCHCLLLAIPKTLVNHSSTLMNDYEPFTTINCVINHSFHDSSRW